jgi:hypothetical protein
MLPVVISCLLAGLLTLPAREAAAQPPRVQERVFEGLSRNAGMLWLAAVAFDGSAFAAHRWQGVPEERELVVVLRQNPDTPAYRIPYHEVTGDIRNAWVFYAVAVSASGERLVMQIAADAIEVRDRTSGSRWRRVVCPTGQHLQKMVLSRDARSLVFTCRTESLKDWSLAQVGLEGPGGSLVRRPLPFDGTELIDISRSPDGRWVTWTTHRGTRLLDGATLADAGWLHQGSAAVSQAWSADGTVWLASFAASHSLARVEVRTRKPSRLQLPRQKDFFSPHVFISPSGSPGAAIAGYGYRFNIQWAAKGQKSRLDSSWTSEQFNEVESVLASEDGSTVVRLETTASRDADGDRPRSYSFIDVSTL